METPNQQTKKPQRNNPKPTHFHTNCSEIMTPCMRISFVSLGLVGWFVFVWPIASGGCTATHIGSRNYLFPEVNVQLPAAGTWWIRGTASTPRKPPAGSLPGHKAEVRSHHLHSEPTCCRWGGLCSSHQLQAPGRCWKPMEKRGGAEGISQVKGDWSWTTCGFWIQKNLSKTITLLVKISNEAISFTVTIRA